MTEIERSIRKLDVQTFVLLGSAIVGIGGSLMAGGYMLSGLQSDTDRNSAAVSALTVRLEKNDSATALLETRVVGLETVALDAIKLRRELDGTVGGFRSDIAVIKEILTRMDKEDRIKP
jgi:hypothetical protein